MSIYYESALYKYIAHVIFLLSGNKVNMRVFLLILVISMKKESQGMKKINVGRNSVDVDAGTQTRLI